MRHRRAIGIEAQNPRRCQRAAEGADQSGRMKADLMKAAFGDRTQSCRNFHRSYIGRQQGSAVHVCTIGQRQRTRKAAGGRMDHSAGMGVVEVEAMDEDTIHEHGVA